LDDSTDETRDVIDQIVQCLKNRGYNISVIRRPDRVGYKAGALQNGLLLSDAEYIAIFDADFIPPPDFLLKSLAFFVRRPKLGFVQGRWSHLNQDASLLTKVQSIGIDGHFMIEQAARSWNGLFMNFNGTAGIFRRAAIESAGGWEHDTLTEDMDLSYRIQLNGWETEYVPDIAVLSEIPEDINAFKNQQFRWAKGSIQTAIKIIPMLIQKKIPLFRFTQAVLHLTHYVVHPVMIALALLTMPVLYFVNAQIPLIWYACMAFFMLFASSGPSVMYIVAQHFLGNKGLKTLGMIPAMMIVGTGLAVNNARAVIEAVFKKESPFHRTPKKGDSLKTEYRPIRDWAFLFEIFLGVYCAISFMIFLSYANFIIGPFLLIYSAGFLFVGLLSIIHYKFPRLINLKWGKNAENMETNTII
jgi:glycosyltransferase involved in cell wall biosynthesis